MDKQPLVTLQEVSWRYEERKNFALSNINLTVNRGETVGITGPSGSGKTTLLLAVTGLIPSNYEGDFSGHRTADGEIGIVFQDPETQFVGLTVEEEVAFSLENRGCDDGEIEQRIAEALQLVGLSGFNKRSPFELSGGEKQRVAIASALATSPQILVLDEPTSELDPVGAREVFSLLERLKKEREMTILVSSHATEEIARLCDRIVLISSGEAVYDLPTREFFRHVAELTSHGIYVPDLVQFHEWLLKEEMIDSGDCKVPLNVEEMLAVYEKLQAKKGAQS